MVTTSFLFIIIERRLKNTGGANVDKLRLDMTLNKAYSRVSENVIKTKASVITACAEIERYFRVGLNYDMAEEINSTNWIRVSNSYPFLANMTMEQFNRFIGIFKDIRDLNAHLHLCYHVHIDEDIVEYLTCILPPDYLIEKNNELTLYGEAYVLFFLIQKSNLFPFLCAFFRYKSIEEMSRMNLSNRCDFLPRIQHVVQEICCESKYIYPNSIINKNEYAYQNTLFRSFMTKFVYYLENALAYTTKTSANAFSLKQLINKSRLFRNYDDIINLIIFLRNCWLHGVALNETIDYKGETIEFTYSYIFSALIKIKEFMSSYFEFDEVISEIRNFAQDSFDFYLLRIVELSFKILDKRLLTSEKIGKRTKIINSAYDNMCRVDSSFYEMSEELLGIKDFCFKLSASKFTDKIQRTLKTFTLKLVELHSEDGFDIGEFHTDNKRIVIATLNLNSQHQNKINGKYLSEYQLDEKKRYSNRIIVYSVKTA